MQLENNNSEEPAIPAVPASGGDSADGSRSEPVVPDEVLESPEALIADLPLDPTREINSPTDLGNAARLARHHLADVRWTTTWGWVAWDGRRWRKNAQGSVDRAAVETIRVMSQPDTGLDGWAFDSKEKRRLTAMVDLSKRYLEIDVELFDQDPWILNVRNGSLDLRTGTLHPHRRTDYLTRLAGVEFDPDAEAPTFDRFLDVIFDGDHELIGYVQRAHGYTLVGGTDEQVIFLPYGTGANGKSTLTELDHFVLGDYSKKTPMSTFLERRSGSIPNDLAALTGVRMVAAAETDIDRKLAEGIVKAITGSDTIAARLLYKEFFNFRPQFTAWLSTNHLPSISGTDHGIWRRLKIVPFLVTIPAAEQDRDLPAKLRAEAAGVLAWMVRGCLEWQKRGLDEPEVITGTVAAYRSSQDHLALWLEDECDLGAGLRSTSADLYHSYQWWVDMNGGKELRHQEFGRRLAERGFHQERRYINGKRSRVWVGLHARERSAREQMG